MKLKYLLVFVFSIGLFNFLSAQVTFSPYTYYAAGQIEQGGSGSNHAMGGTGIAFSSSRSLNNLNPASYTGIDSLSFIFDVGVFGKYASFQKGSLKQNKYSGNIRYIAMGARIAQWWSASVGVAPYSSVGYSILTADEMEGESSYYYRKFTGSGGINQFYFGNSFKPFKGFSVGINLMYLLGSIEQKESVSSASSIMYNIIKVSKVSNFNMDYGLQYKLDVKKLQYTIGAIYGYERSLKSSTSRNLFYSNDTVEMDNDDQNFMIPQKYGVGFAVEKKNKFKVGIDYESRAWSKLEFSNPKLQTRDSERFSFGLEYTPMTSFRDMGFMRWYYRVGANYNKTYLIIDNEPINSKALTFGLGIPLRKQLTMFNVSFEIGEQGTTANSLIKERYYLVHLNFALQDFWFLKPKYN